MRPLATYLASLDPDTLLDLQLLLAAAICIAMGLSFAAFLGWRKRRAQ